jgi:hypothetical protein
MQVTNYTVLKMNVKIDFNVKIMNASIIQKYAMVLLIVAIQVMNLIYNVSHVMKINRVQITSLNVRMEIVLMLQIFVIKKMIVVIIVMKYFVIMIIKQASVSKVLVLK